MIGKLMNILPVSDLWQNATQVLKQLRKNKEPRRFAAKMVKK